MFLNLFVHLKSVMTDKKKFCPMADKIILGYALHLFLLTMIEAI